MAGQNNFNEPVEELYTTWYNPLEVEQYVDIREGDNPRPTRFRVAPGGTKDIPKRYDSVVHRVHNGVIIGGQAPQLVDRTSDDKLDPVLDTDLAKKRNAEVALSLAAFNRKEQDDAVIVAAARAAEADRRLQARAAAEQQEAAKREAPVAQTAPQVASKPTKV